MISESAAAAYRWKLGDLIPLKDSWFKVVGIVQQQAQGSDLGAESASGGAGRRDVYVPFTLPPYWSARPGEQSRVDVLYIRAPVPGDLNTVVAGTRRLLLTANKRESLLAWTTPESLLENIRRLQRGIRLTAGSVTLLSLMLGGATLMSLMVANVRDRIMEIGLRRALGATTGQVAILFVLESCLVTGIAALAGTVAACLLVWFTKYRFSAPVEMGGIALILPVLVSLVLGFAFSYWPAQMAARVSPAEALRNG